MRILLVLGAKNDLAFNQVMLSQTAYAKDVKLYGSAEADWAGNLDDIMSTAGHSFF